MPIPGSMISIRGTRSRDHSASCGRLGSLSCNATFPSASATIRVGMPPRCWRAPKRPSRKASEHSQGEATGSTRHRTMAGTRQTAPPAAGGSSGRRRVDLRLAAIVPQRQTNLLPAKLRLADGVLADRFTAVIPVIVSQPLQAPPDPVPLLEMGHTFLTADGRHDWRGILQSGTIDCDFGTFRECRPNSRGIDRPSNICSRGPNQWIMPKTPRQSMRRKRSCV